MHTLCLSARGLLRTRPLLLSLPPAKRVKVECYPPSLGAESFGQRRDEEALALLATERGRGPVPVDVLRRGLVRDHDLRKCDNTSGQRQGSV